MQEERTAMINQAVTKGLDPNVPMKDSGIEWLGEIPEHWEVKKIDTLSECLTGFAFKSDHYSFEEGVKLVRGDNVTEGRLRWGDKTRLWQDLTSDLERYYLEANDILISMDGSKVGKNFARIKSDDLPLLLVQRVTRIRPKNELISKYLEFSISSYNFKYYVNSTKTDPAVPHITLKNIRDFKIFLPPEDELIDLISHLESELKHIDDIISNSLQETNLLKEYKTALISEVVTGKLDVREEVLVKLSV